MIPQFLITCYLVYYRSDSSSDIDFTLLNIVKTSLTSTEVIVSVFILVKDYERQSSIIESWESLLSVYDSL